MIKTLSVSIFDTMKDGQLTIAGTQSPEGFNTVVTVAIGGTKIAVDSKELAEMLKAVVDFQSNIGEPRIFVPTGAQIWSVGRDMTVANVSESTGAKSTKETS